MKSITLAFSILISLNTFAVETTDGFCTMDVLNLVQSNIQTATASNIRGKAKQFAEKALKRAKNEYRNSPIYWDDLEIVVESQELVFGTDNNDGHKGLIGAIIKLSMDADEDIVTYYFTRKRSLNLPLLQMYLHDEQSATSYWTCEY